MTKKQKKVLVRIIITSIMLIALIIAPIKGLLKLGLFLVAYLIIGYDILKKACMGIINGRIFDENFLMAVATVGAFALAIYSKSEDYAEGITVMLFYQIGELFQTCAVRKSRKNIASLMDIRPDYANIEINNTLTAVHPSDVSIGSIIVVRPGEKIPIDGIVVEGNSSLNTTALTGESKPKTVYENDEVLSGCINLNGILKIKTTKKFADSTVSKILNLVENASSRKSKSENFISKFAKIYTPAVCISALILAILPPTVNILFKNNADWNIWLYRALTFLVVSCPCALVISIPLSFFAGIGGAGKAGILIKGSNFLEALSKTEYIVFDKTGTLTQGVFEVSGIHHNEMENERLLEYAALAESASSHPISKSLQRAYGKKIEQNRVKNIKELSGYGITAEIDDVYVAIGNNKLMKKLGINYMDCHCTGTIIHMAINNKYAGHIVISDIIKPNCKKLISSLKKAGIKKAVMLTGDSEKIAEQVAKQLDIDAFYSELLPEDKVIKLENLLCEKSDDKTLAFVGDGINDAPVLMRADIGIAMGAIGSDAAIEAADVVLMDDDPLKILKAIKISKKCLGIVKQNIIFSLGVKFACLALTILGISGMWLAIFADVGVMVLAVLNAVRALN